MIKLPVLGCLKKVALMASIVVVTTTAFAGGFPTRGLVFVAGYKPGGGHDTMLRMMAKVLKSEGIIKESINIINKPGGSSAVSMGYLNGKKGNGHYLMSITSSHITTPLNSNIGLNFSSFTPIARLGIDPELLVVNAKGEYKTLEDILSVDKVLNVGGTGTGTIEHIIAIQFGKKANKKINYIPYQGDGEVAAALLSNQIDFVIANPGSVADFIRADRFKALAISTENRIEMFPELKTFKEQNLDISLSLYRGLTAPAGISKEAKLYWISKLKELDKNPMWKEKYLEPNSVVPGFIAGKDFEEYLRKTQKVYKETLTELGLIK